MKKKCITKASKRRLLLFGSLSVVSVVYFLMNVSTYVSDIYNLKKEKKSLEIELVNLQADEKNLKTQLDMLKDVDYLARYARENYLYSKDGEIVLKIEEKENENKDSQELSFDQKYIFYIGGGMLGVLILYVLLKKGK